MASETVSQYARFRDALKSEKPIANTWQLIWHDKAFIKAVWNVILSPIDTLTLLWHADSMIKYRVRENNLEMANNAGVKSVAVSYGAHDEDRLMKCRPQICVDSFEQILEWHRKYDN